MKYAVIDIGSNSIRLLTCEFENQKISNSEKQIITTRLGKGVDSSGLLAEDRILDTLEALKAFVAKAEAFGAKKIIAMATSAVRDSSNKQEFIERVYKETRLNIEVLTGDVEAEIGFLGVLKGLKKTPEKLLVIDIGGGSTELIFGDSKGIDQKISVNVGAVRMTDKFFQDHQNGDALLRTYMEHLLTTLKKDYQCVQNAVAVGIGGTATTFAAMALALKTYDRERVHGYMVSEALIKSLNKKLSLVDLETRKKIPGLDPKRADIIIAGGIILEKIINTLGYEGMIASDFDNLEGYLFYKSIDS